MHIEYHKWWSPSLNRHMELKVYGHYGKPLLGFPCSRGRFCDFESYGMIETLRSYIEGGHVKIFTIDGVDAESWYNFSVSPYDRNRRHEDYDRYVIQEVIPFIHRSNQNTERIITFGYSMGALHCLNFFLRHPDVFGGCIGLSGLYSLEFHDFKLGSQNMSDVYYNSPLSYIPHLNDGWFLNLIKNSRIVILCGQGKWEKESIRDTLSLKKAFEDKGIPAWVELWGHDSDHDWPWWKKQMPYVLDKF